MAGLGSSERVKVMTRRQVKEQAARYAKFVEWSEEDKCFIGRCPELMLGGIHGKDEAKVYAELCAAVEEMIELIHADGQEPPKPLGKKGLSGRFVLRVDPAIHERHRLPDYRTPRHDGHGGCCQCTRHGRHLADRCLGTLRFGEQKPCLGTFRILSSAERPA